MAKMTARASLAGVLAAVFALFASSASAYNLPVGPAVPTSYEQCRSLGAQYSDLTRELFDQTMSCHRGLRISEMQDEIYVGECGGVGFRYHPRRCAPAHAQWCSVSRRGREEVRSCQDRVRAYQEHQRRAEREREFERGNKRFLLERAKGVGERVGEGAARAGLAYELGRRNIKLGRFEKTLLLATRYAGLLGNRTGEGPADPYRSLVSRENAGVDLAASLGALNRLSRALTKIAISEIVRIRQEAVAQLTGSFAEFDQTMAEYQSLRSSWSRISAVQDESYAAALGTGGPAEVAGLMAEIEALKRQADAAREQRAVAYQRAVAAVAEARRQAAIQAERQRQAAIQAERARQAAHAAEQRRLFDAQQYARQQPQRQEQPISEEEEEYQPSDNYGYAGDSLGGFNDFVNSFNQQHIFPNIPQQGYNQNQNHYSSRCRNKPSPYATCAIQD